MGVVSKGIFETMNITLSNSWNLQISIIFLHKKNPEKKLPKFPNKRL